MVDIGGQILTLSLGEDDVVHARAALGPTYIERGQARPGYVQRQLDSAVVRACQVI